MPEQFKPLSELGGKVENGGVTPNGKASALDWNSLVYHVKNIKAVVDTIDSINVFEPVYADELPTASESTMGKLYFVPSEDGSDTKEMYVTINDGGVYKWLSLGTSDISVAALTEQEIDYAWEGKNIDGTTT